jgi:integrase
MVTYELHTFVRIQCGYGKMAEKITDGLVKTLPKPKHGERITYDTTVKGFGIRVTAAGARSFLLNYRTRLGRERRYTIGSFPDWKTAPARTEAIELKKQIDRGGDPLGDIMAGREAPTVADLCNRFEADYLPRRRPSTQTSYRQQIAAEIKPSLGRLKVAEVTFADVDGLHRKITKRGVPYRANRVIATLSRMFTMAIKWRMRPDNPVKGIERNQEHRRRRYLSAEELKRLIRALDACRDQQSADIVRLLMLTGARRGETLQARWDDFDLAKRVWRKPGATTKQKTEHQVPLSEAAVQLMTSLRRRADKDAEWVFPAADGGPRRDVKDAWGSLCRAASIKSARLHDLRHTYASVLASAGLSLPVIGALLGHTQPATTHRYAHLFDDPLRAAAERAGAIITGAPAEIVPLPDRRRGQR